MVRGRLRLPRGDTRIYGFVVAPSDDEWIRDQMKWIGGSTENVTPIGVRRRF